MTLRVRLVVSSTAHGTERLENMKAADSLQVRVGDHRWRSSEATASTDFINPSQWAFSFNAPSDAPTYASILTLDSARAYHFDFHADHREPHQNQ
jgi:hypothetical protein